MGALGRVRIHYTDLPVLITSLIGATPVYGTFLDGENIYSHRLSDNGLIVMGNEGNGIGKECSSLIEERLLIPNYPTGRDTSESLNVSTATAIICAEFRRNGIRTSIFVGADPAMVEGAAACGADRVELYTEPYAAMFPKAPEAAVAPFIKAAEAARECGLGLNAGHDLSLENLEYFIRNIPWTDEVSIGHALISDALYMGLEQTIKAYLSKIKIF